MVNEDPMLAEEQDPFIVGLQTQLDRAVAEFHTIDLQYTALQKRHLQANRKKSALQVALDSYRNAMNPPAPAPVVSTPSPVGPPTETSWVQTVEASTPELAPQPAPSQFEGPHSKACHWIEHFHGKGCAEECPTCHGVSTALNDPTPGSWNEVRP